LKAPKIDSNEIHYFLATMVILQQFVIRHVWNCFRSLWQ
jgi:hypothetical protein